MSFPLEEMPMVVVGAGPAGLSAALEAARAGVEVTVMDENEREGGQLRKQIHRFFGSRHHGAGKRGMEIAEKMARQCREWGVEVRLRTAVLGCFPDGRLMVDGPEGVRLVKAGAVVIATGAVEKSTPFPGWTLPGVMGAGAAQTLANLHGVLPGRKILMVGSGNVGLIVAYQLLQAGADVVGIVEAADRVGGYEVHACRVRREGVPIYLGHRLRAAEGRDEVDAAVVERTGDGKKLRFKVDCICLALGMSPQAELAAMGGCRMVFSRELGGFFPWHDRDMRTDRKGIYVAGDACGVEEASVAMEEGRMAGLSAARDLGFLRVEEERKRKSEIAGRLEALRKGSYGAVKGEAKKRLGCF